MFKDFSDKQNNAGDWLFPIYLSISSISPSKKLRSKMNVAATLIESAMRT